MPFTFSHPAIVLPLNYLPKKWVSLTGLIAGSIAPDFEYFLRLRVRSDYSHTWFGIFWIDLPIALLLSLIYHNWIKISFINHLPSFLHSRFFVYKEFNWKNKRLPVHLLLSYP